MSGDALRAWTVDSGAFPTAGSLADKARFAVGYAILAPSSHNTQPWKFAIIGDELLLMADRSRSLPVVGIFRQIHHNDLAWLRRGLRQKPNLVDESKV